MKTILNIAMLLFLSVNTQAQIWKKAQKAAQRGMEKTVERKVEKKASEKTEEAMDKVLEPENRKKSTKNPSSTVDQNQNKSSSAHHTRNPEVNGQLIFSDNFANTPLGDFPIGFTSSSGGSVTEVNDTRGLLFNPNTNMLIQTTDLPANFALEFDLTLENVPPSLYNTFFNVYVQQNKTLKHNDPKNKYGAVGFSLWGDKNDHQIDLFNKKTAYEIKERIPYNLNKNIIDQTSSWVILRNGNRLQLYINGKKIADSPNLLEGMKANSINFRLNGTKREENHRFIISSVKVTAIKEDLRSQLIVKGTLTTSEIYFDSGSDQIQNESFDLLNDIANILKDEKSTFLITGHTDSDGDEKSNLELSKSRAISVKKYLQSKGVSSNRLQTEGKGEKVPVASNNTADGKAQNRRVVFTKL